MYYLTQDNIPPNPNQPLSAQVSAIEKKKQIPKRPSNSPFPSSNQVLWSHLDELDFAPKNHGHAHPHGNTPRVCHPQSLHPFLNSRWLPFMDGHTQGLLKIKSIKLIISQSNKFHKIKDMDSSEDVSREARLRSGEVDGRLAGVEIQEVNVCDGGNWSQSGMLRGTAIENRLRGVWQKEFDGTLKREIDTKEAGFPRINTQKARTSEYWILLK